MRGLLLVALVLLAPLASAQVPVDPNELQNDVLYDFTMTIDPAEPVQVAPLSSGQVVITIHDTSSDSPGQVVPGAPQYTPIAHRIDFSTRVVSGDADSWTIPVVSGFSQINAGETRTTTLIAQPATDVSHPFLQVEIIATMTTESAVINRSATVVFFTHGLAGYVVSPGSALELQPGATSGSSIEIFNAGLLPITYEPRILSNPCGAYIVPPTSTVVPPLERREIEFSVRAPTQYVWSSSRDCSLRIGVEPLDGPGGPKDVPVTLTVTGLYIPTEWGILAVAAVLGLLLLAVFIRRRKQLIEEEILGKPQKPWTIPVERVYLEHLEERDPRAAYVVRHFLMEEEYASALLWYKHYKQATRGERAKESMVVRQEKKYDRFKAGWEKQIAAPLIQADKFEARLQKRLDRLAKREVRKERRKWKKLVAKLEKAVESQNAKTLAKWEKAAAKAEKKGNPVPPKPELLSPDLPPEPQLQKIHLADHKWNKKAAKFRKKMVKRQGDLEVKFEKKDARMLHKLRRKVQKIARKLDDPDFVEEHPLLAKGPQEAP